MSKQKGICEECKAEYEYEYNPKYPRKYCPECSAKKKQAYEDNKPVEVVKPGEPVKVHQEAPKEIKAPTGEYQSLVYNKTLSANSYEVGKSGSRFKIYFESVKELQEKMAELKTAGLMEEEIDFKAMKELSV